MAIDQNAMKLLTFVMRHLKSQSIPHPLFLRFRQLQTKTPHTGRFCFLPTKQV
jgi:hypothetical protein